jgi:hypothetical protein
MPGQPSLCAMRRDGVARMTGAIGSGWRSQRQGSRAPGPLPLDSTFAAPLGAAQAG